MKKLEWRHSRTTGYHYFGDGKYDHGHCFKTCDGEWGGSHDKGFGTFKRLRDAKRFVEQGVKKQMRGTK
jgi:hypothetical protein